LRGRGHSDETIRNWAKTLSSPNKVALSRAARTYEKRHLYKSKRQKWSRSEYHKRNEDYINANVKAMEAVESLTSKVATEIDETVANMRALENAEDVLEEFLTQHFDHSRPFASNAKAAELHDVQLRYAALCHGAPLVSKPFAKFSESDMKLLGPIFSPDGAYYVSLGRDNSTCHHAIVINGHLYISVVCLKDYSGQKPELVRLQDGTLMFHRDVVPSVPLSQARPKDVSYDVCSNVMGLRMKEVKGKRHLAFKHCVRVYDQKTDGMVDEFRQATLVVEDGPAPFGFNALV